MVDRLGVGLTACCTSLCTRSHTLQWCSLPCTLPAHFSIMALNLASVSTPTVGTSRLGLKLLTQSHKSTQLLCSE